MFDTIVLFTRFPVLKYNFCQIRLSFFTTFSPNYYELSFSNSSVVSEIQRQVLH